MSEDRTSTTVASEGGDVRPPSNHSTSRKRIKIIPPKRDGNSRMAASEVGAPSNHSITMKRAKPSPGPQTPRVQLVLNFDGLLLEGNFDTYIAVALSSFNETNQAQGAPLYEVVKALGFIWTPIAKTYHFNFIARPKDGTDAEDKLFFAEVNTVRGVGYRCNCCCIIGPPDSKTGLCGCGIYCVNHPNHVQHPPQGGFRKKLIIGGDFLW